MQLINCLFERRFPKKRTYSVKKTYIRKNLLKIDLFFERENDLFFHRIVYFSKVNIILVTLF